MPSWKVIGMNSKRLLKNLRQRRRGFQRTLRSSKLIDKRIAAKARIELVDSIIEYVEQGYRRFNDQSVPEGFALGVHDA